MDENHFRLQSSVDGKSWEPCEESGNYLLLLKLAKERSDQSSVYHQIARIDSGRTIVTYYMGRSLQLVEEKRDGGVSYDRSVESAGL